MVPSISLIIFNLFTRVDHFHHAYIPNQYRNHRYPRSDIRF